MIIYYAMTKFHLIFSITHKLDKHKDEKAILFLYSRLQGIETNIKHLKETGIFVDIFIVPEIELRKKLIPLNDNSTNAEIEKDIKILTTTTQNWLPIKISTQDTLYIANDQWALGTYCIYHKIPYIYYEDGVGMLSKPDYSYELVRRVNVSHAIIAKYLGAFGQNKYVIKKLADLENQSEGFHDEKAVHYCLREKLEAMPTSDMQRLLYIFDAPKCPIDTNSTILLTEHFVNMKRLSIEGQKEIYALLVDLFSGENKLYIKPHPNDFQIDYTTLFGDGTMIPRTFPSELLPYCFDGKLDLGLAACSTSIFGLKNILDKAIRFDIDIEHHYKQMLKYYVLNQILDTLFEPTTSIYTWNTYDDLLNALEITHIELTTDNFSKIENKILMIDEHKKEDFSTTNLQHLAAEFSTLIFLDFTELFNIMPYLITTNIIPFKINKKKLDTTCMIDDDDEFIWFYTTNSDIKKSLEKMEVKKNMKYSKVIIDASAMTDNKDIQIKILQGNLAAMVERLENYMENEHTLQAQIRSLEKN